MLVAATAGFAVLALDIAYPAVVLSVMGTMRWLLADVQTPEPRSVMA